MKFNPYNVNQAKSVEEFYKTHISERVTVVAIPKEAYKQAVAPTVVDWNNRFAMPEMPSDMGHFRGLFNRDTKRLVKDVDDVIAMLTIADNSDPHIVACSFMNFGSLMACIGACYFGNFAELDMQYLLYAAKASYNSHLFYGIVENLGLTKEQKKNAQAGKSLIRKMYATNLDVSISHAFAEALKQTINDMANANEITIMEERELLAYVTGLVK